MPFSVGSWREIYGRLAYKKEKTRFKSTYELKSMFVRDKLDLSGVVDYCETYGITKVYIFPKPRSDNISEKPRDAR